MELHRKFSVPFACLVFGLVGVPLGIQPARAVKSRGFSVSLALIFLYYLLLTAGEAMAEKGVLAPVIALWLPNAIFALLGLGLFTAASREVRFALPGRLAEGLAVLRARWQPVSER